LKGCHYQIVKELKDPPLRVRITSLLHVEIIYFINLLYIVNWTWENFLEVGAAAHLFNFQGLKTTTPGHKTSKRPCRETGQMDGIQMPLNDKCFSL
jgi:hypothetical protein